jgi:tRNA(Ile)-lysidine synthase
MTVIESFYSNIFQNSLIKSGDKIILAVSGGPDSICMLHLFWRLSKKINIELIAVNLNHGLRKEAQKEALIVKSLSEKLKIKVLLENFDVKKYAKQNSISIETAGRILRYETLEKIACKYKFNKIATAHNANDNAETVLMWLIRGSGNFYGIPHNRKTNKNIEIIRPLLNIKRNRIEHYLHKQKLIFCIDKSNFSDDFTRNKIRKFLIPEIEKINPKAIEHIFAFTKVRMNEEIYLNEICLKLIDKCVKKSSSKIILDLQRFLGYNPTLRYRILKTIIPEKQNSFQINSIANKILFSDKNQYGLSKNWIFNLNEKKAIFKKVRKP